MAAAIKVLALVKLSALPLANFACYISFRFLHRRPSSRLVFAKMRIAIIGQGLFSVEVYRSLVKRGHEIVGVFTVPDSNGRPDVLAKEATVDKLPVFKFARWRLKGACLPEVLAAYNECRADLNVLPFCSQFIPSEVIYAPPHKTIIYHPSILPAHRGASAINWTLISGDQKAGLTVFWADDGLDTGPILLQRSCDIEEDDTLNTLYRRFLFPEGVKAVSEAVDLIAAGNAPRVEQPTEGASYEPIMKKELAHLDLSNKTARQIHNFIRGNDKQPGTWLKLNDRVVSLFGSQLWKNDAPKGDALVAESCGDGVAICNSEGLLLRGTDGHYVVVRKCELDDGKLINASELHAILTGKANTNASPASTTNVGELSEAERNVEKVMRESWSEIIGIAVADILPSIDFFKAGAGSLDASRMVETVRSRASLSEDLLAVDDVYMNSTFAAFVGLVVTRMRHGRQRSVKYDAVEVEANGMRIKFPRQQFIDGSFADAASGRTFATVNPATEEVICQVALGGREDVDRAVSAAKRAFYDGEWSKMSARDRGKILFRLADLMEENKELLATLESLDSGAVYTLALKTHVGMSIDTFRYFAGWCDKIEGEVIPINHARPSRDLTFTRKEPIGVCGIVTPWNYPLMMLSWKMAACLAAGNTIVMKPAQVTPLTALKFAELTVEAGFPPGVINILPGSGSVVGQAIADHPDIRKLGFTGSTEIGKVIMDSCAKSNLKKCSLELGGKSPLIIFADCDLQRAVRYGCSSVFFNKGENCIAAGRLFVEQSIHDEFVKLVLEEVRRMKIGDPFDRSTDHGPQNHKAHLDKLIEFCEQGVREGAKLVCGGKRFGSRGFYFEPTIFTEVRDEMMIAKEESFGPVMIISSFADGDLDGVLRRANATEYGLASGVFTRDVNKALTVAERLEAGTVFVNTYNKTDCAAPFGGFKQSGFGKDLGREALNEYLRTKAVTIEYGV